MIGGPVPGTEDEIHIYRSGDLMRMEGLGHSYQITNLAKQQTHGISKTGCLQYNAPFVRSYPYNFTSADNTFERTPVKKETIDGHVCQVEDVVIYHKKKIPPSKMRVWEAEDLQGFPIKIENRRENGRHWIIRYENVELGPQDPTLFIVPDKCQSGIPEDPNEEEDQTPTPKKTPGGKSQ